MFQTMILEQWTDNFGLAKLASWKDIYDAQVGGVLYQHREDYSAIRAIRQRARVPSLNFEP